ncbi:MAG TPA: 2-hydroxychromene-2-carboxylate isomerase [Hyphomicrobiaceae bacterium]|nr:2-hydroxychromene-2-carboxylate isomerase [Hyphomicrobiaceae bacterium]
MADQRTIEFWYDFASTYSYLSAMRVEAMAQAAGVGLAWKPFLLGPIFQAQGWTTSPFNLYPVKGKYMVRDIERLAGERGLEFRLPPQFPQNSLLAARVALIGADEGWVGAFTRAIYLAQFRDGSTISDPQVLGAVLDKLGLDPKAILARTQEPAVKERLRQQTAEAQALGIFGAPSFVTGGEVFWGDDRLEQALSWTKR